MIQDKNKYIELHCNISFTKLGEPAEFDKNIDRALFYRDGRMLAFKGKEGGGFEDEASLVYDFGDTDPESKKYSPSAIKVKIKKDFFAGFDTDLNKEVDEYLVPPEELVYDNLDAFFGCLHPYDKPVMETMQDGQPIAMVGSVAPALFFRINPSSAEKLMKEAIENGKGSQGEDSAHTPRINLNDGSGHIYSSGLYVIHPQPPKK